MTMIMLCILYVSTYFHLNQMFKLINRFQRSTLRQYHLNSNKYYTKRHYSNIQIKYACDENVFNSNLVTPKIDEYKLILANENSKHNILEKPVYKPPFWRCTHYFYITKRIDHTFTPNDKATIIKRQTGLLDSVINIVPSTIFDEYWNFLAKNEQLQIFENTRQVWASEFLIRKDGIFDGSRGAGINYLLDNAIMQQRIKANELEHWKQQLNQVDSDAQIRKNFLQQQIQFVTNMKKIHVCFDDKTNDRIYLTNN